ncbi:hypothetical protein CEXT_479041 [Caerostris extrusa]|uniref:Ion transport domain-containing protein n=1 Tax=Caerostris extrusa TaxID=172846 RepID=A0AAV4ULD2_CAEEX|nr:hypothetical protein CEXT_479041 [Caerostris extrusa]
MQRESLIYKRLRPHDALDVPLAEIDPKVSDDVEALHQSISRGFIFGTYSYLKNPWMCFDFIITIATLPSIEILGTKIFKLSPSEE